MEIREPFEPALSLTIPDACKDCPVLHEMKLGLVSLLLEKRLMEDAAATMVGEQGEAFDRYVEEAVPEDIDPDRIKTFARKEMGKDLEILDRDITAATDTINATTLSCNGVLKMRAAKDDVTYTVAICTSQRVHLLNSEHPHHSAANIWAKTNPDKPE
jgi:hypothetical protein